MEESVKRPLIRFPPIAAVVKLDVSGLAVKSIHVPAQLQKKVGGGACSPRIVRDSYRQGMRTGYLCHQVLGGDSF